MAFCIPNNFCVDECMAFLAYCTLAEMFTTIHMGIVTPDQLNDAVERFLQLFSDAFGADPFTAKFHWLLHYPKELAKHLILYACFVHERKHKQIRRFAVPVKNTTIYEITILEEVSCQHHHDLQDPQCFSYTAGLQEPKQRCGLRRTERLLDALNLSAADVDAVYVGMHSRANAYEVCSKGDVVLIFNGTVVPECGSC